MTVHRYNALIEVSIECDAETSEEARAIGEQRVNAICDALGEGNHIDTINGAVSLHPVKNVTPFEGKVEIIGADGKFAYPVLSKENKDGDLEVVPDGPH